MGEMRDSDWSRENFLRSDWLLPTVAIYTTILNLQNNYFRGVSVLHCLTSLYGVLLIASKSAGVQFKVYRVYSRYSVGENTYIAVSYTHLTLPTKRIV